MKLNDQLLEIQWSRSLLRARLPVLVTIAIFSGAGAVPDSSIAGSINNTAFPQAFTIAHKIRSVLSNARHGFSERSLNHATIAPSDHLRPPAQITSQSYQEAFPPAESPPNTWYVSRRGSNGEGQSWETAWNEMDQIIWSAVRRGDTILIDGMVYNTPLIIDASGTSDAPITLQVANGMAVIDGGVLAGCPAQGSSQPRQFDYGIELRNAEWVVIDGAEWGGFEIRNTREAGINLGNAQDVVLQYLRVHHNGADGWDAGFARQGWQSRNVTISHSEIFANGNDAIHGTGANGLVVEYNYIHDHYCGHPDGLQGAILTANSDVPDDAGRFENVVVRYNIFADHENGAHGMGIFLGETGGHESWVDGLEIHDNLFIRIIDAPIRTKNANSTNIRIFNNTFIGESRMGVDLSGGGGVAPIEIRDNIFYKIGRNGPLIWARTQGGQTIFADNCVFDSANPGGNFVESGTISANPQFVDASVDNYALEAGSPCAGKGSTITSAEMLIGELPTAPPPADLNQDGHMDVIDVQLGVNVYLGTETQTQVVSQADVNQDGEVNVLDIQIIVNAVLSD